MNVLKIKNISFISTFLSPVSAFVFLVIILLSNTGSAYAGLIFDPNSQPETGNYEIEVSICANENVDKTEVCSSRAAGSYTYLGCKVERRIGGSFTKARCNERRRMITNPNDAKESTISSPEEGANGSSIPSADNYAGYRIRNQRDCDIDNGFVAQCSNKRNGTEYYYTDCGVIGSIIYCSTISERPFTKEEIGSIRESAERYLFVKNACTISDGEVEKCVENGWTYTTCILSDDEVSCRTATKTDPDAPDSPTARKDLRETTGVGDSGTEALERESVLFEGANEKAVAYESFTNFPGVGRIKNMCQLIEGLWFLGFIVLFIGVVGSLLYGGFLYTSAGVNIAQVNQAKGVIQNAFIGLGIGLSIFVILQTIDPNLLSGNCEVPVIGESFEFEPPEIDE